MQQDIKDATHLASLYMNISIHREAWSRAIHQSITPDRL